MSFLSKKLQLHLFPSPPILHSHVTVAPRPFPESCTPWGCALPSSTQGWWRLAGTVFIRPSQVEGLAFGCFELQTWQFHLVPLSVNFSPPGREPHSLLGPFSRGMVGPGHACWMFEWLALDQAFFSLGFSFPSVTRFSKSPHISQRATLSVWGRQVWGHGAASFWRCRALGRQPQAHSCPPCLYPLPPEGARG